MWAKCRQVGLAQVDNCVSMDEWVEGPVLALLPLTTQKIEIWNKIGSHRICGNNYKLM